MKRGQLFALCTLAITLVLYQCGTLKVEYKYPEGLTKEKQAELEKRVKKGKHLFRQNCENCHGITHKTKDSAIKLVFENTSSYQNAFLKGDYKNHAFAQGLSKEELTDILLFLAVLKKK